MAYLDPLVTDLPVEFRGHFERADGERLRLTVAGARDLLPRLARRQLSLPNPAPVTQVRAVLRELSEADLAAGMAELGQLLTRTDLSHVERDVLESLAALHSAPAKTPVPSQPASTGPAATVVDLQAWRSRRAGQ